MDISRRSSRGFTLIELLIVIAILGIVINYAVPTIRSMMDTQKMKSATFDLVTTTMFARSEAVKFGPTQGVSISIVPSGGTNAGYSTGWCVMLTCSTSDPLCSTSAPSCSTSAPGADVMRVNAATANVTYSVYSCGATPCVVTFSKNGRLSSGTAVKFEVTNDDPSNPLTRCVTIDAAGNPSTKVDAC